MAGNPNLITVVLSKNRPISPIFNKLLRRCTIAVKPIAISIGKNKTKTGVNIVPKPNPEKKVSKEAPKAKKMTIKYCSIT